MKEKEYNGGKWTYARYRSFITSALRAASRRWPPKYEALKRSFTRVKKAKATNRDGRHYECAICKKEFRTAEVQVDHIVPIGRDLDWNSFIEALFCESNNLQVLCKACHKIKTRKEHDAHKEST